MQIERWQAWLGCGAIILSGLIASATMVDSYFAKAEDLTRVADRAANNEDGNFRLEQMIINNTRTQRKERGWDENPSWLKQQQRDLDYRRCLAQRARDKRIRCNK